MTNIDVLADCIVLFLIIITSSMLFCNALEHLGYKLGLSEGITGSIFAATATALPETLIALIPVVAPYLNLPHINFDITIGAILGAPLMLSTLSLFIISITAIKQRGLNGKISSDKSVVLLDLKFFLIGFSVFFIFMYIHLENTISREIRNFAVSIALITIYFIYVCLSVSNSKQLVHQGKVVQADSKLILQYFGCNSNKLSILLQLIMSVIILCYFAREFVSLINNIANKYNVLPFVSALILIPIATELPEKVNSILWLRQSKDTLALSNITGALVFQGNVLPIIWILFANFKDISVIYLPVFL